MKKLTAFVLSAMMVLSLAACGAKTETPADTSTPAADATKPAEVAKLTYAVEAGSAGGQSRTAAGLFAAKPGPGHQGQIRGGTE